MPKLRYKEHDKKKEKRHRHKHHKSSSSSQKRNTSYKPPTLYEEEEGWIPPVDSQKEEEAQWREHLFEAMMDDEGQDPFYLRYEHASQPTPSQMTDEEYRQHIVSGMYERTHKEEIAAEKKRKAEKERKQQEREELKRKMAQEDAERIRLQNVYSQLEDLRNQQASKTEYVEKWKKLESLDIVHKKDIPWPIIGKIFSFDNVKLFVLDPKAALEENKKNVRKEQLRYHPDKFITKYIKKKFHGSQKEKERVMARINEISGWLNELWTQVNV